MNPRKLIAIYTRIDGKEKYRETLTAYLQRKAAPAAKERSSEGAPPCS